MNTLNDIVYSILTSVKPHLTDDEDLTFEKIAYDVRNKRSVFIRNEYNKNRSVDSIFVQDLGCVPVTKVDAAECCDFDSGCKIVRTTEKIPTPIATHRKPLIQRVGPVNKLQRSYNIVTYKEAINSGNGAYNHKEIYTYFHNGYIYLVSKNENVYMLKYINIQGVFENPEDVSRYNLCDSDTPCYDDNSAYPLPNWMEEYIKTALKEEYIKVDIVMPKDLANDSKNQATDA